MFVHSADKLAKMQTKFHVIQAKLIMSIWCFTVHCCFCGELGFSFLASFYIINPNNGVTFICF